MRTSFQAGGVRVPVVAVEAGPVDVCGTGIEFGETREKVSMSTVGHYAHVTVVAPTDLKMSSTCRHATMYSRR